MNKNYYHIERKRSAGGIGFCISVWRENFEVLVGKGKINKQEVIELKVKNGKIISLSKDYTFTKIYEKELGRLKRKAEKYQKIL